MYSISLKAQVSALGYCTCESLQTDRFPSLEGSQQKAVGFTVSFPESFRASRCREGRGSMLRYEFPGPSRELFIVLGPGKRIPGLGPYIRTQTQGRACQNMDCPKHNAYDSHQGLLGLRVRWTRQTVPTMVRQDGKETWHSRP